MRSDEFADKWQDGKDSLDTFPLSILKEFPLRFDDKQFLAEVGLPSEAAPFLSFGPKYFSHFITQTGLQIGANGTGDPIIIALTGEIYCLNHEEGFDTQYVNRDLSAFLETLLLFRNLIDEVCKYFGPNAFLDGLVPKRQHESWLSSLKSIDPAALNEGSFWTEEMATWIITEDDQRL